MKFSSIIVSFLANYCYTASSHKILCFFPTISKSQLIYAQPLMEALAEKGHSVTVVSPFPLGREVKNYRDVVIPINFDEHSKVAENLSKGQTNGFVLNVFKQFFGIVLAATNETISHPDFQKIMKEDFYDIVIHGHALNPFQIGLGLTFKCPSVLLASVPPMYFFNKLVGQPSYPEAVPHFLMNIKGQMTFLQRVLSLFINIIERLGDFYIDYVNKGYYEIYFPSDKYPSYETAMENIALILVNSHFTQIGTRPLLPNIIEVAGMHIKNKPSPLPEDIRTWVEGVKDGFILVSLGTNIKSADLSLEKRQALLNAFGKLKQRVLWKFEDDSLKELPKNVMLRKWVPQSDLLAHSNIKIFISHMGIGGYNEAKYHGVPVLAIPFAADQPTNAEKARLEGWAEVIPPVEMNDTILETTLHKMLHDQKYKKAVHELSSLYKDRPMTPVDTAIYWIEYVIRYNGAPQLKYAGRDLNFIQKNSLDVFGFLAVVVYLAIKILCWSIRKIKKCFWNKKTQNKEVTKKNQ